MNIERTCRHPATLILVLLVGGLVGLTASADVRVQKPEFLITLPDGWFEVPREELDTVSAEINRARTAPIDPPTQISYAFQLHNDGLLALPNITIAIDNDGRIAERELESINYMNQERLEREIAKSAPRYIAQTELVLREYNRADGIAWMQATLAGAQGGPTATALVAIIPTEYGMILVTGSAMTSEFAQYEPTFRACFRSIKVDPSMAYRFSLFRRIMQPDTAAGAFGVLIMWIAILIAGVMLVVYVVRNWLAG